MGFQLTNFSFNGFHARFSVNILSILLREICDLAILNPYRLLGHSHGVRQRRVRDAKEERQVIGPTGFISLSGRSEEHTSELQSRFDLVCRLLLEKNKKEISLCLTFYAQ